MAPAPAEYFTLDTTIQSALAANLRPKMAAEDTRARSFYMEASRTRFYPTFGASYQYQRNDEQLSQTFLGVVQPKNEYRFSATVTQPIFTGFALRNQHEQAKLGVEAALFGEATTRQEILFEAKQVYFTILKAQKILSVSLESVQLLEAQQEDAKNFFAVGMIPLNDLLKSQVELANTRLSLVSARNNLEIAQANFNTLLRRPVNAPVALGGHHRLPTAEARHRRVPPVGHGESNRT